MDKTDQCMSLATMERKFLKIYKQLSHLWNPNHPDYNNRVRRNAGYDALLPVYRQYMPKATRFHIRQKINIIRSCYRKELRKHLASKTVCPDGNVIYTYTPTSWKFNALRFLNCDEDADNDDNAENIDIHDYDTEEPELEYVDSAEMESGNDEPDTSKTDLSPIFIEEDKSYSRKQSRNTPNDSYTNDAEVSEREFNAIGSNVACKLQRMNVQQRYHAELLINKVLIYGLKDQLSDETDLSNIIWNNSFKVSLNYSKRRKNNDESREESKDPRRDQDFKINVV